MVGDEILGILKVVLFSFISFGIQKKGKSVLIFLLVHINRNCFLGYEVNIGDIWGGVIGFQLDHIFLFHLPSYFIC